MVLHPLTRLRTSPTRQQIKLSWLVGHHSHRDSVPDRWLPATVPGAVQLDWCRAMGFDEPFKDDVWRELCGLEDRYWTYVTKLPDDVPFDDAQRRLVLVCGGVDYRCDVLLGDQFAGSVHGLYQQWELPIDAVDESVWIRVYPAPKAPIVDIGGIWTWAAQRRGLARASTKTVVSYGDDFHPPLPALGIWRPTYLELRPSRHIIDLKVTSQIDHTVPVGKLDVCVRLNSSGAGCSFKVRLLDPDGALVVAREMAVAGKKASVTLVLEDPRLWWPTGYGEPECYEVQVELCDEHGICDSLADRVAFRSVALRPAVGAWFRPHAEDYPKTRSEPAIALHVNGVPVFVKGLNCVPPHVFPGATTDTDYVALVDSACHANANLLRISGGGHVYGDAFYDRCDETGMLVWQDFPLACNEYPEDDGYIGLLEREARTIIERLRTHPSLALWCGGNELFNAWSRMTEQSRALRLLNRMTYDLDPCTPFLPTTPLMGMGHGYYQFENPDHPECLTAMAYLQAADCTAYPEVGCPAPPPAEVVESTLSESERFPPRPGTAWESHGAFYAHDRRPETWLNLPTIERYFGTVDDLNELCLYGQTLQAVALQGMVEEARRQRPRCSLVNVWCLNEPWPALANLSLIAFGGHPKLGYLAVREAFRPLLASARLPKFSWEVDEMVTARLYLLGESSVAAREVRVEAWFGPARLSPGRLPERLGGHMVGAWRAVTQRGQVTLPGPELRFFPPSGRRGLYLLQLIVLDREDLGSSYLVVIGADPSVRLPSRGIDAIGSG